MTVRQTVNRSTFLAEEFVARYRRGERPALAEYVEGYPELAEQIRALFPALLMMEKIKPAEGSLVPNPPGGRSPPAVDQRYRLNSSAISGSFANLAGAEWGWFTRRSRNRSAGTSLSRSYRRTAGWTRPSSADSAARPAQAAGLHHTNIVPVFAVGEQDGVPYYAMQFIRGQGIDVILDELRQLRHNGEVFADQPPFGLKSEQNAGHPESSKMPALPCATGVDGVAVAATIAERLLSGQFVVSVHGEPDQPESGTTRIADTESRSIPRRPARGRSRLRR